MISFKQVFTLFFFFFWKPKYFELYMYWCIFKMNQYIYNSEHLGLKYWFILMQQYHKLYVLQL